MLQAIVSIEDYSAKAPPKAVSSVNAGFAPTDRNRPLVVDLEGTLLRRSLLAEGIAALLRENPLMAFVMLLWLMQGKEGFRARVLARANIDMALLPINDAFTTYAKSEAARGREIVLVTAAPHRFMEAALRRFRFVSRVTPCSGAEVDQAETRAMSLARQFPGGFHYAGAREADLAVWQAADHIIIVNPARKVARGVRLLGRAVTQLVAMPAEAAIAVRKAAQEGRIAHEQRTIVSTGVAAGLLVVALGLLALGNAGADPQAMLSTLLRLAPLALVVCAARATMLFVMDRSGASPLRLALRDRTALALALLGGTALAASVVDATALLLG